MKTSNHYHPTTNRTSGILAALEYLQNKPEKKPTITILRSFLLPRAVLLRLAHRPLGTLPPIHLKSL